MKKLFIYLTLSFFSIFSIFSMEERSPKRQKMDLDNSEAIDNQENLTDAVSSLQVLACKTFMKQVNCISNAEDLKRFLNLIKISKTNMNEYAEKIFTEVIQEVSKPKLYTFFRMKRNQKNYVDINTIHYLNKTFNLMLINIPCGKDRHTEITKYALLCLDHLNDVLGFKGLALIKLKKEGRSWLDYPPYISNDENIAIEASGENAEITIRDLKGLNNKEQIASIIKANELSLKNNQFKTNYFLTPKRGGTVDQAQNFIPELNYSNSIISFDNKYALFANHDEDNDQWQIKIFDLETDGKTIYPAISLPHNSEHIEIYCIPNKHCAFLIENDLLLMDFENPEKVIIKKIVEDLDESTIFDVSPDGKLAFSISNKLITLYDLKNLENIKTKSKKVENKENIEWVVNEGIRGRIIFSNDNKFIAAITNNGKTFLFNIEEIFSNRLQPKEASIFENNIMLENLTQENDHFCIRFTESDSGLVIAYANLEEGLNIILLGTQNALTNEQIFFVLGLINIFLKTTDSGSIISLARSIATDGELNAIFKTFSDNEKKIILEQLKGKMRKIIQSKK